MTAGADLRLLRAAVFTAVCVLLSATGHVTATGTHLPPWALGAACAVVFAAAAPLAGRERSLPGIAALLTAGQVALHVLFAAAHAHAPTGAGAGAAGAGGAGTGNVRALAHRLLCDDVAGGSLSHGEARRIVADAGLSGSHAVAGHAGAHPGVHAAQHAATAAPADGVADCVRGALDAALTQISLPMLLGHLLAAAAVGLLLHRGETALWRLVRLSATPARAAEELLSVRALRTAVRLLRALCRGLADGDGPALLAGRRPDDPAAPPRTEPLAGAATRRGPPLPAYHFDLAA